MHAHTRTHAHSRTHGVPLHSTGDGALRAHGRAGGRRGGGGLHLAHGARPRVPPAARDALGPPRVQPGGYTPSRRRHADARASAPHDLPQSSPSSQLPCPLPIAPSHLPTCPLLPSLLSSLLPSLLSSHHLFRLSAQGGGTIVLVGATGSGKRALVAALLEFGSAGMMKVVQHGQSGPSWQGHIGPPRSPPTAFEGLRLLYALGRRGLAPQTTAGSDGSSAACHPS